MGLIIFCMIMSFIALMAAVGVYKIGNAVQQMAEQQRPRVTIIEKTPLRIDRIDWIGEVYPQESNNVDGTRKTHAFIVMLNTGEDLYLRFCNEKDARGSRAIIIRMMVSIGSGPITDQEEDIFYKAIGEEINEEKL